MAHARFTDMYAVVSGDRATFNAHTRYTIKSVSVNIDDLRSVLRGRCANTFSQLLANPGSRSAARAFQRRLGRPFSPDPAEHTLVTRRTEASADLEVAGDCEILVHGRRTRTSVDDAFRAPRGELPIIELLARDENLVLAMARHLTDTDDPGGTAAFEAAVRAAVDEDVLTTVLDTARFTGGPVSVSHDGRSLSASDGLAAVVGARTRIRTSLTIEATVEVPTVAGLAPKVRQPAPDGPALPATPLQRTTGAGAPPPSFTSPRSVPPTGPSHLPVAPPTPPQPGPHARSPRTTPPPDSTQIRAPLGRDRPSPVVGWPRPVSAPLPPGAAGAVDDQPAGSRRTAEDTTLTILDAVRQLLVSRPASDAVTTVQAATTRATITSTVGSSTDAVASDAAQRRGDHPAEYWLDCDYWEDRQKGADAHEEMTKR